MMLGPLTCLCVCTGTVLVFFFFFLFSNNPSWCMNSSVTIFWNPSNDQVQHTDWVMHYLFFFVLLLCHSILPPPWANMPDIFQLLKSRHMFGSRPAVDLHRITLKIQRRMNTKGELAVVSLYLLTNACLSCTVHSCFTPWMSWSCGPSVLIWCDGTCLDIWGSTGAEEASHCLTV